MPALPPFIARYEIKQRLGQGGMGAIYLARDPVIDRLVAVKLLHSDIASDDLRRRFAQEARASGALTHPNIVTIHDFGEFEGAPFIVMEYVRGETMAEVIKRRAELPIIQKLRWVEQVCNALGYAHGENVIHRDVKPSNLMIDQHGTIKILDFGIARIVGAGLTKMSMVIGTPAYMSPEQIQGGAIDARSDVFAVGAVFYELLCYREAFAGDAPHAVMSRVVSAEPQPLRQLLAGPDLSIADVVETALQKNPESRYQDMAALESAIRLARTSLEALRTEPAILAASPQQPPSSKRRRRTDPVEIARRRAEQIELHLDRARRSCDAGDFEAAISACEEVLLLDPSSAAALALLEQMRQEPPTALDTLIREAREALRAGQFETVERLLGQATFLEPKATEIRLLRTELHDRREGHARAERRVRDASATSARGPARVDEATVEAPARLLAAPPAFGPSYEASIDRIRPWAPSPPSPATPMVSTAPTAPKPGRTGWLAIAAALTVVAIGGWVVASRMSTREFLFGPLGPGSERIETPARPQGTEDPKPLPTPNVTTGIGGAPSVPTDSPPPPPTPSPGSATDTTGTQTQDQPPSSRATGPDLTRQPPTSPLRTADPDAALRVAEDAENQGDLNRALAQYREVLRRDPKNVLAPRRIARIRAEYLVRRAVGLFEAGDHDAAIRDLNAAAAADPGNQKVADLLEKVSLAKAAEARKRPPP